MPILVVMAGLGTILLVLRFQAPPYAAWLVSINLATFVGFGWDKASARRGGWRVAEMSLHGLSVAGGFGGGFLGSSLFRHKTNRKVFLLIQGLSFVLHAAVIGGLIATTGSL